MHFFLNFVWVITMDLNNVFAACDVDNPSPPSNWPVVCSLGNSSLMMDCCLSVEIIQKSFRFFMELDACNYKLLMEIENLKTEILLFENNWGKPQVFRLQGALLIQSVPIIFIAFSIPHCYIKSSK